MYSPPALLDPVVLQTGYTPPALTEPVVLCADDPAPGAYTGTALVTTTPPAMPAVVAAAERPAMSAPYAWVRTLYRPAAPAVTATGAALTPASIALATSAPAPPVTVFASARGYEISIALTTAPHITPATASAACTTVTPAVVALTTAPHITPAVPAATVRHNLDLPDALRHGATTRHATAARPAAAGTTLRHTESARARTAAQARHTTAAPASTTARLRHAEATRHRTRATTRHAEALRTTRIARTRHAEATRTRLRTGTRHAEACRTTLAARTRHAEALRRRPALRLRHAEATPATRPLATRTRAHGAPLAAALAHPIAQAIYPPPGYWWPIYNPPGLRIVIKCNGTYTPPPLRCPVVLAPDWIAQPPCPQEPDRETIVIPILGAYIVINEVYLTRVSDGAALEASSFTASLDAQSWTWGWSATVPAAQLPIVRPAPSGEPVEVLASINGISLRLVVESITRDRRFANATLRIGGRGRAAWLADPHSPIQTRYNTQARTAAQLLDDALTLNAVSIGWTVDWQATDWLVPAGAWSHTGTYIDAAKRLAEAAGAYVQAHDTDQTLHILPWYPAKPWDWPTTTPDIEIPEDVCEVEGIEWLDKPAYNAVYVVGAEGGRRDRIKRAGSAADHYAPTIVDPLATAPEMTLARGGQALADTGRQAHITLRLPVLPETGIIKPGQLIRYTEQGNTHLGMTRSVSLQHDFPQLWQTIKVETHELEATP